jgi:hypothetical protein
MSSISKLFRAQKLRNEVYVPVRRGWTCCETIKAQIKNFLIITLALMSCLVSPEWASGSRPVGAMIIGCVIEGLFISRETTLNTDHGLQTAYGSHFIRVTGVDLKRYEGQTLRLTGSLSPGNHFVTNEQKLQQLAPSCDTRSIPNFKQTFSWACRTLARERSAVKAYEEALRYINRSIETDPTECEFYVTRSEIYEAQGRSGIAAEDEKQAAMLGCKK